MIIFLRWVLVRVFFKWSANYCGFRQIVIENIMLAFCLRRYPDGDRSSAIGVGHRRNGTGAGEIAFIDGMPWNVNI